MGVPQKAVAYIKPEEYLALEEKATTRHEYLDGVIYAWQGFGPEAMAGGTRRHNRVCLNIASALQARLEGSPCVVYMTEVRLRVEQANAYFYPDVMISCSLRDTGELDKSHVDEPSVVFEVLSDSTEQFDRGEKFSAYKQLDSLRTYVLVSAHGRSIEVHVRGPDDQWHVRHLESGELVVDHPPVSIPVDTVFRGAD